MHGLHRCCPSVEALFRERHAGSLGPRYLCPVRPSSSSLVEVMYFAEGLMLFCWFPPVCLAQAAGRRRIRWRPAGCAACCAHNRSADCRYPVVRDFARRRRVDPRRAAMSLQPGARDHAGLFSREPAQLSGVPRWFWIRDNLGQEMYHSNNDLASSSDDVNNMRACHRAMQLHFNPPEAARMRRLNEVEYIRGRMTSPWIGFRRQSLRFAALHGAAALDSGS